MTINNAVQKAISDNLPSAVAEELKQFIAKAQQDSVALEKQKEEIAEQKRIISSNNTVITDLQTRAKRTHELDELERNIKVFTAELKANAAEARATELHNLVNVIFKNQTIQRTVTGNVPIYVPPAGNGGSGYTSTVSTSTTETEQVG